jgi:hypothetical protein
MHGNEAKSPELSCLHALQKASDDCGRKNAIPF